MTGSRRDHCINARKRGFLGCTFTACWRTLKTPLPRHHAFKKAQIRKRSHQKTLTGSGSQIPSIYRVALNLPSSLSPSHFFPSKHRTDSNNCKQTFSNSQYPIKYLATPPRKNVLTANGRPLLGLWSEGSCRGARGTLRPCTALLPAGSRLRPGRPSKINQ